MFRRKCLRDANTSFVNEIRQLVDLSRKYIVENDGKC
ncbi:MAG: hypothetical protein RL757_1780 [Bacteroidota bacterium]